MTDIVEKLERMPIAEWLEARNEIVRLRGILGNTTVMLETVLLEDTVATDTTVQELTDKITSLEGLTDTLRRTITTLEDEAVESASMITNLEAQIQLNSTDGLQQRYDTLLTNYASSVANNTELVNTLEGLQADVSKDIKIDALEQLLEKTADANTVLTSSNTNLKKEITKLTSTVEKLQEDMLKLKSDYEASSLAKPVKKSWIGKSKG